MVFYNFNGEKIPKAYRFDGTPLESDTTVYTTLTYDLRYPISAEWQVQAKIARDAMLNAMSDDCIPFFIETDSHGRGLDGNKACHNFMRGCGIGYIWNIFLGDFSSYFNDGKTPDNHTKYKSGIEKYIPVMGNHELLANNPDATMIADLSMLEASFGGYRTVVDDALGVKWIVTQPYYPNDSVSAKFSKKIGTEQANWLISELSADDGLDIVLLQHEPVRATHTARDEGTYKLDCTNIDDILKARKQKSTGTFTDGDGVVHNLDFSGCDTEFLCSLHGHEHKERYSTDVYTDYVADWFNGTFFTCCYGLIDRNSKQLKIWQFHKDAVDDVLVLPI